MERAPPKYKSGQHDVEGTHCELRQVVGGERTLLPGENESGEGVQGYCCKEGAVRISCRPAEGSSTRTYGGKEESSLPFAWQTRRCATSPNGTRSQRSACRSIGRYP